jgi:hypothetical protein
MVEHFSFFFFEDSGCLPKRHPTKSWNTLFFTSSFGMNEGTSPLAYEDGSLYRSPSLR